MEFAVAYPARPDAWKDLAIAEDNGFTQAWFYESQMLYSDVFVSMALAAEHTKRMKLGCGVTIPSNRIDPVTANSIATINLLAPGRTILGIGTGFAGRNTMGLPPVSLKRTRECVEICRRLLQGEEVLYREGKHERRIRFLHPDRGYINLKDEIPIHLAATGPKALELTGELADGWITVFYEPEVIRQNLAIVRQGAAKAGRTLTRFPTAAHAASSITPSGHRDAASTTPEVQREIDQVELARNAGAPSALETSASRKATPRPRRRTLAAPLIGPGRSGRK